MSKLTSKTLEHIKLPGGKKASSVIGDVMKCFQYFSVVLTKLASISEKQAANLPLTSVMEKFKGRWKKFGKASSWESL